MRTIGLTGGVGAGKSLIINYLKDKYGAKVILADEVAHKLEEPGQPCYNRLVEVFGSGILDSQGYIDKKAFAKLIFSDNKNLEKVNGIIHPAVKAYILDEIEASKTAGVKLFFLEAALLIEEGYGDILDDIWYIYASEETRRERLKSSRGYDDLKIDSIFAGQLSDKQFREACKIIIDNEQDFSFTSKYIDGVIGEIHE